MIICKGCMCENGQGGALCDTAMIIYKGVCEIGQGVALYDTVKIVCKGNVKTVRGVRYMTQQ